jgi:L-ribulokinase
MLVDAENGDEIASSVFNYPRWNKGLYCNAAENQFRQHPLDYIEGLETTVKTILKAHPSAANDVITNFQIDL